MTATNTSCPRSISAEMKEILRQNRIWRESNGQEGRQAQLERPDLSYTMLAAMDFAGAEMVQAKMERSCFNDASFRGARLHGADFSGADLTYAKFQGADLRGASFTGADLSYANFDGAILERASFDHANLDGATFRGADLTDVSFICCGYALDSVKGAKASDSTVKALLEAVAGLDLAGCSPEMRQAVEQINTLFTSTRDEMTRKEKEGLEAISQQLFGKFASAAN